jgi:hypothetical protein
MFLNEVPEFEVRSKTKDARKRQERSEARHHFGGGQRPAGIIHTG